ncbi:MAG TPA: PA0069 family radical SAM protein [Nevskiaceae bacterium]|nr:PA0069 family radical SAM protein [Nevskiaceae bacterium]
MGDFLKRTVAKGRGADINPPGRFESGTTVGFHDGWERDEEAPPNPETQFFAETARSIISGNDSPDIAFSQSINPYRGCEHGCSYCFARPSHAYVNLSPGLDFETKIFYKPNAAALLEKELSHPRYACQQIALGTNTDPYQPAERRFGIMRSLLQVMQRYRQPCSIVTKGAALIERDLDILAEMGRAHLANVAISITSLRDEIKRTLEPRAASPRSRLRMVRKLSEAGVPVMVMVAPIIPVITDGELEDILAAAKDAGALAAGYVMLRLPWEVKDVFEAWLNTHHPGKAAHVMSLMRQMHGGAPQHRAAEGSAQPVDENIQQPEEPHVSTPAPTPYRPNQYYSSEWGVRQRGSGPFARLFEQRFKLAASRLGLDRWRDLRLDTSQFRVPPKCGDQISLFS